LPIRATGLDIVIFSVSSLFTMSLSRCGRLARVSLGALRTPASVSTRAFVPRTISVRGVSSASRDAQQKVGKDPYDSMGLNCLELVKLT
jgi:hypothetical protein